MSTDCSTKLTQEHCSEYISLPELLSIDVAKWKHPKSLGRNWKRHLRDGGGPPPPVYGGVADIVRLVILSVMHNPLVKGHCAR